MNNSSRKVKLPGFGLPLAWDREVHFPNALHPSGLGAIHPLPHYAMMQLMNEITDKTDWQKKIFDEAIVQKWREETVKDTTGPAGNASQSNETGIDAGGSTDDDASGRVGSEDRGMTAKMFDEVNSNTVALERVPFLTEEQSIAELKYKADLMEITNSVEAADGVFKSDTIIPEQLRISLENAVAPLENIPEREKDWHPETNRQVLDLVHPSLYPLVYGQTRILSSGVTSLEDCFTRCGEGVTIAVPEGTTDGHWSLQFQWLPSNFEVSRSSDNVKITSYINNLHPAQHPNLYRIIEQVVAKIIPMWNQTLTCTRQTERARVVVTNYGYGDIGPEPEWSEGQDEDEYNIRMENWREARPIVFPEPERFEPPAPTEDRCHPKFNQQRKLVGDKSHRRAVDLRTQFDGSLQIIVKLANIHLTPDKPEYPGGSWHVEGQANENICASAIYYYSCDNVSDSFLSFRHGIDFDEIVELPYPQSDHRAVETIYDFDFGDRAIKEVGSVLTRQSRVVTFSNRMEHRVNPFSLVDTTRPGHRKILALFLVDPHERIISTANVPCQQKAWWDTSVRQVDSLRTKLPPEILDHALNLVDGFPVSLDVAKEQREILMQERSFYNRTNDIARGETFNVSKDNFIPRLTCRGNTKIHSMPPQELLI